MAKLMERGSAVPFEDVVPAQAFEFEALLNVLERHEVINRDDDLVEMTRWEETTGWGEVPPGPPGHRSWGRARERRANPRGRCQADHLHTFRCQGPRSVSVRGAAQGRE